MKFDIEINTGLFLGSRKTNVGVIACCKEEITYTKVGTAFVLIIFVVGISVSIL